MKNRRKLALALHEYAKPNTLRSLFEVAISALLLIACIAVALYCYSHGYYWAMAPLMIVTAIGFCRCFAIHHECGHFSMFRKRVHNRIAGTILALLAHTPHYLWSEQHAVHHKHSSKLSKRGVGDIPLLTTEEYLAASKSERLKYLIGRHPLTIMILGPLYLLLYNFRFYKKPLYPCPKLTNNSARLSIYSANVFVISLAATMIYFYGVIAYLLAIFLPLYLSALIVMNLFYIQHNYEDSKFYSDDEWNHHDASLYGSSFLDMPAIFNWATANIAFHHIHHYNARIPYYNTPKCMRDIEALQHPYTIRLKDVWRMYQFKLYNEKQRRFMKMSEFKQLNRAIMQRPIFELKIQPPTKTIETYD